MLPLRLPALAGILLISLHLSAALAGAGAALPPATPEGPPRCDAPQYRQFDFWVGDWDVTVKGKAAGTNSITVEESGCLIHEHWSGAGGLTGQSFNFYNREDDKWHQVWVSSGGDVLNLAGRYADGVLTYQGVTREPDGRQVDHRLSFHANPDGTVRQRWETSSGGGSTWTTVFDGLYRKRGA
jgi:hypothetical protein